MFHAHFMRQPLSTCGLYEVHISENNQPDVESDCGKQIQLHFKRDNKTIVGLAHNNYYGRQVGSQTVTSSSVLLSS